MSAVKLGQRKCVPARGRSSKVCELFAFYLLEAIVHHRAENLRHHQADPDSQQQGGDDPDRGDNDWSAGHVGDAPVRPFEYEWTSRLLGGCRMKKSLCATQLTRQAAECKAGATSNSYLHAAMKALQKLATGGREGV